jgi:hypothetical protein
MNELQIKPLVNLYLVNPEIQSRIKTIKISMIINEIN